jgi:hypothetical protein
MKNNGMDVIDQIELRLAEEDEKLPDEDVWGESEWSIRLIGKRTLKGHLYTDPIAIVDFWRNTADQAFVGQITYSKRGRINVRASNTTEEVINRVESLLLQADPQFAQALQTARDYVEGRKELPTHWQEVEEFFIPIGQLIIAHDDVQYMVIDEGDFDLLDWRVVET